MNRRIVIYDTSLRDGAQTEGLSLSRSDRLRIAQRLDKLGITYIEGGWPFSNPKDADFFQDAGRIRLKTARLSAFGSTCRVRKAFQDENLKALLAADTRCVTIFGKSWLLHVREVLRVSPKENLAMITGSCRRMAEAGREVIFDAEHFFDGWKDDPAYADEVLKAAIRGGASTVVLCDTNGGTLPDEVFRITAEVKKNLPEGIVLGIHCHNDGGLAVANTLAAVKAGADHVQGTINGVGERCGNADLCAVIPNLELKMGLRCLPKGALRTLRELSRFFNEITNIHNDIHQPFVGDSAFAHKGGTHVNAVAKDPATFEHVVPESVGNTRRIIVSELSGHTNVALKTKELGISATHAEMASALEELKYRENHGYEYELAEASFALLMARQLTDYIPFFELFGYRVTVEKRPGDRVSIATVKVRVGEETNLVSAESTSGPVNALDMALRKALLPFYPELQHLTLSDYKVRILAAGVGTAATTRVLIESSFRSSAWMTIGVSENLIDASWEALVDSVEYALLRHRKKIR